MCEPEDTLQTDDGPLFSAEGKAFRYNFRRAGASRTGRPGGACRSVHTRRKQHPWRLCMCREQHWVPGLRQPASQGGPHDKTRSFKACSRADDNCNSLKGSNSSGMFLMPQPTKAEFI